MALMELDSPALNPPPLRHPAGVSLRGLHKSFGRHVALSGVDLDIRSGEFMAIVGPSGCGKSTLLRLVAGLEEPTAGEVWIGGRPATDIPAHLRDIAMVFQAYALYPHLTVYRNLATSLELRKLPRAEVEQRVEAAAAQLDIAYLLNRRPGLLSGGQRQRVALARALVRKPALFLLDEPLSNVDAAQRTSLRREIVRLHRALGATFVYVTHDQTEAMMMADRIAVMNAGRIEQVATPQQLRDAPATAFVADFIGAVTSLAATMERARSQPAGRSLQ
jgi:multiple sugar transport system ATP-binding protein